ncbi:hypothetical protein D3C83_282090 [compost metagenome]
MIDDDGSPGAMATASIATESKKPMLASCDENPPSESVVKLCTRASSHDIPAIR